MPVFARVLDYLKVNPSRTKMDQRNGGLRLSIDDVTSPHQALELLEAIAGIRAEQAAPEYRAEKAEPAD